MGISRLFFGLLASFAFAFAQANTVDLSLSGIGGSGQSIYYPYPNYGASTSWSSLSGLSQFSPTLVANGDIVNVTLNFASPAWTSSAFGLSFGSVPNDLFDLSFGGVVSGAVATSGTFALYMNHQLVANSPLSGGTGINVVQASASFNPGTYAFDQIISSFTVSGLNQPASLQSASLNYFSFPPTQLHPPILDPSIIPLVPEPSSTAMTIAGLAFLVFSRRGRRIREF